MKMCGEKPCNECPFSNTSLKGWLASYTIQDFIQFVIFDVPFPCHKAMGDDDIPVPELTDKISSGTIPLCRGYAELLKKSCKRAKKAWFGEIIEPGPTSMNLQEFVKHHEQFKTQVNDQD